MFVYKGKAVRVPDVARDLGVRYVVEGSVRKAGARVRVNVQLIEAESGKHIWAERYDRELRITSYNVCYTKLLRATCMCVDVPK